MKKEFIPYEQALALKELGFDEPCFGYYENATFIFWYDSKQEKELLLNCSAPLYQQCFRWFREKYKLDSWVYKSRDYAYFYSILKDSRYLSPSIEFTSYEEAELECLVKLIDIVK
jgi:hypothetical protein